MNELLTICHQNKLITDKYIGNQQCHSYVENFYGHVFPPRKFSTQKILEIGIATGGSLWLWERFFPSAMIYAVDKEGFMGNKFMGQPRIITIEGDAYSNDIVDKFANISFDIIIDDGPHTLESQVLFLKKYIPKVAPGGIIIIEDIASEDYLPILGESVPENLQDRIKIHDTCKIDNRFDSRILYIEL